MLPQRIFLLSCLMFATSLCGHCLAADKADIHRESTGEAEAIAALREGGFKVRQAARTTEIGFGQPEWTPELWRQLSQITSLKTLRGTAKCADNAGLEVLAKLPRLETVFLNASTFDDEGFAALAKIQSLQTLALDHNAQITGRGASALKALPRLRSLRFGGCMKFSREGFKASAELVQLESLQLHHCGIGDEDLPPLAKMAKLKHLFVSSMFNGRLTGAGMKHLAEIQTLESLKVGETVMTYEDGLADLTRLSRLKKLELDKVGASEADIEKLRHAMPHTEIQWTAPTDAEVTQFRRWSAGRREHSVPGGEGMTHSGPRSNQESR